MDDYHVVLHKRSAIAAETLGFGTSSQTMECLGWDNFRFWILDFGFR